MLFVTTIFLGIFVTEVKADESSPGGAAGFSYAIEYPDNQIEKAGYFNLLVTPGQKQTLNVKVINPTSEKITVNVDLNGARTNKNGVVEYGTNQIEKDASMKFPFEEIAKAKKSLEIPANRAEILSIELSMPQTEFDGLILGGIQLSKDDSKDKQEKVEGSQIKNKYNYIVGVSLRNNFNEVIPKLALNRVYAEQFNYQNAIFINYSNVNAQMLENMSIEAQISKKGEGEVLYETKKTNMRMAPNSFINFPVSMEGEKMIAGDYVAKILVQGDGNIREEWTKEFKITKEEADKFNTRDLGLVEEKGVDWKFVAMIVVGSLVAIGLIYGGISYMQHKKNARKKSSKNSSSKRKTKKKK